MHSTPHYQQEPALLMTGASSVPTTVEFLSHSKFQIDVPISVASSCRDEPTLLPEYYQPSDYCVICGRGKGSYNKPGNKRFRAIVRQYVSEYASARTKFDKSSVLHRVIDRVKEQNGGHTLFLSFKQGRWYEITEDKAREKVGHCMRETIALLEQQQQGSASASAHAGVVHQRARERKEQYQPRCQLLGSDAGERQRQADRLLQQQRAIVDGLLSSTLTKPRTSQFQQARQQQRQGAFAAV